MTDDRERISLMEAVRMDCLKLALENPEGDGRGRSTAAALERATAFAAFAMGKPNEE